MLEDEVTRATRQVSESMSNVPLSRLVRAPLGNVHVPAVKVVPFR
ncbi:hypothetical protein MMCCUG48898_1705 [Mycobacteroides abscessus subsp. massiliense CCUG 48898 = JCM 15300]|nr:hypothetical protein MMCCUG48898_1705 [Mycobacteroides abscessus subsp. massiliense CCUG 48898 = JCM 15300]